MMQTSPRIAVISTTVPPGATGQARVLGHLIGHAPPDNCLLLTEQSPFPPGVGPEGPLGNYRVLAQLPMGLRESGWVPERMPTLNSFGGILRSVGTRAREISSYVREFNVAVMIACTASPFDLPACTLAALWHRLPLIAYLFDDPIFQWAPGTVRSVARLWEPIWSITAAQVLVPNEAMAEEFARRRARNPIIIRNPVAPEACSTCQKPWPATPDHLRIVYTGSVYQAQADAFMNLLAALDELRDWSLHIYTSQSETQLAAYGIEGARVFRHEHVEQSEAYKLQRSADVLFLPLAFRSTIPEALRTSAPMKLGEYLAAGRPILAHAPPDTFVARHLRQHHAAVVVDAPENSSVAAALREISNNAKLRENLYANAARLAQDYNVDQARLVFWNAVRLAAR